MSSTAKVWIITDPSKSGTASLTLHLNGKRVDDPLAQWPTEVTLGPECQFSLAGDKDSKDIVRRLSRAYGELEIVRCELEVPNIGKFDGRFSVVATDDLFLGRFSVRKWTAMMKPEKLGAVRFRPRARTAADKS